MSAELRKIFRETETGEPLRDQTVIDRIADKWTVLLVSLLSDGRPHRFNELRRNIEGISQKMLTQTLRDLERDGLVVRTLYPEVPPRVEYALTPMGVTLCEPIQRLGDWASTHVDEIKKAQTEFDARTNVFTAPE